MSTLNLILKIPAVIFLLCSRDSLFAIFAFKFCSNKCKEKIFWFNFWEQIKNHNFSFVTGGGACEAGNANL